MHKIKATFLLPLALAALAAGPVPAQTSVSVEAVLENSPVSCFYMLMHAYRRQLDTCGAPLDEAREERFSRMAARMEEYILNNARLDPEAIVNNARGMAEQAAQSAPIQEFELSSQLLGGAGRAVQNVPYCESTVFRTMRQAMLNFTTAETEAELYAQLDTGLPVANGSCY